uniref:Titin n=1 Tax=Sinocyclocheilus rhinocerous TaxID=307959 RepID=A0A673JAC2_9TELE
MAGISPSSKVSESVVARDPCDPPGTPEAIVITRNLVTLQWAKPQYDGGSAITGYIIERKKLPDGRWMKASFTNIIHKQFTITGLEEEQRYEFRVIAKNAAGNLSVPSESTGSITAQDEIEAPSVSMDSKFKDVITVKAGESFTIDADIAGKPLPDIMWLKDGKEIDSATPRMEIKSTITQTVLTVKDCIRVDGGHFLLSLSNVGGTKQVPISVKVLDRPGPPDGPLNVTELDADLRKCVTVRASATLRLFVTIRGRPEPEVKWTKADDGRWLKCNFTNLQETFFDVTGLIEDQRYDFHIIAKNAAGLLSEPSEGTGPVTVKDDVDPPRITIEDKLRQLVVVKAGDILRIDAEISGRPIPVISWAKDGKEIEAKARFEISSTLTSTTIIVRDAIRRDSGQYVLTLQNVAGTRSLAVNCKVLDRPGPSAGPLEVTGLTAEKCTLNWGPPQENGGAEIQHYIVEKRETSRLAWTLVYADMKATTCKATKLLKGNEYIFRVRGVNKYGTGEALESDPVKAMDPFTIPAAPTNVEVSSVTSEAMTICWERPVSDGGSSISGYVIEKREKSGLRWVRVNKKPVYDLRVKASNLREGCEYEYRVFAENAAGLSAPSVPCPLIKAEDPLFLPSPPAKPKIIDSSKTSITLSWNKPLFDGGSRITNYLVEALEKGQQKWIKCGSTKSTHFVVYGLRENAEYYFRVRAENHAGLSDPKDMVLPIEIPLTGKPLPKVSLSKDGQVLKSTMRFNSDVTTDSLIISLRESVASDAGRYDIMASNSSGTTKSFVNIVVLDRPSPPVGPVEMCDVTEDSVSLKWLPPAYDGGSPITNYIVFKRETTTANWIEVSSAVARCTIKIMKLINGVEYQFRIRAENRFGISDHIDSPTVTVSLPYSE